MATCSLSGAGKGFAIVVGPERTLSAKRVHSSSARRPKMDLSFCSFSRYASIAGVMSMKSPLLFMRAARPRRKSASTAGSPGYVSLSARIRFRASWSSYPSRNDCPRKRASLSSNFLRKNSAREISFFGAAEAASAPKADAGITTRNSHRTQTTKAGRRHATHHHLPSESIALPPKVYRIRRPLSASY